MTTTESLKDKSVFDAWFNHALQILIESPAFGGEGAPRPWEEENERLWQQCLDAGWTPEEGDAALRAWREGMRPDDTH